MFDAISYGKAGAVLNMVENYEGRETFRQGVHKYLTEHEYGNATAEDFWNAQTAVSHKPVDKIMDSLITEPGVPLLTFGEPGNGTVSVEQRRFYLSPKHQDGRNAEVDAAGLFQDRRRAGLRSADSGGDQPEGSLGRAVLCQCGRSGLLPLQLSGGQVRGAGGAWKRD